MKPKRKIVYVILFFSLSALVFCMFNRRLQGYYMLNLAFSLAISILAVVGTVCFFKAEKNERQDFLILMLIGIVSMFPFIFNNFLYGDDYWGFQKSIHTASHLSSSIIMRRPFNALLFVGTDSIGFDQSYVYRTICILVSILNAYLLYHNARRYRGRKFALAFAALSLCCICTMDSIAYMSTATVVFSLLFSEMAFVCFDEGKRPFVRYGCSMMLLLSGFFFYQISTPIIFVMFVVGQYREKKTNDFMDALKLLLFYGAAGLLYMLLSSWLMHLYGYTMDQATQNRATFIHTPEQIIFKINWLFQTVIPQAVLKSTAIFLRLFGFKTNCLFYEIHLKSTMIENLVMTISGGMILIYYIKLLYKHRFFKFFIDLIAIVLSFYPFLILPESYTLSYYMIPIVTLFLYFELSGLEILANLCNSRFKKLANYEKNFGTCVFALLLSVCIFSGNAYTNWWVEYNRDSYMFIKQSLSQKLNEKTKSICVLGSISPYVGGNPYVVFSTQQALTSLGYDLNNYEFFQMDNEYYISTMSSVEMEQVKKRVTADKFERFRAYFLHDEMYNRWLYTYSADEDGLHFMQEVLIQSGLGRFKETTENVVISLSGFNEEHDF